MSNFNPGQRVSVHNQEASVTEVNEKVVDGETVQMLTVHPPIVYMSVVRHVVTSKEAVLCEEMVDELV